MKVEKLIELGLTRNQAKTYVELITRPKQAVGDLARRLSIDRSFMYSILRSLNNKGLVGYVMAEGRKMYHASSPENLLEEIEEKRALASDIIKELKEIDQTTQTTKSVNVFEGKSGLKLLARLIIKEQHFKIMGGAGILRTLENLRFEYPHYVEEIRKKSITGQIIASQRNTPRLNKELKGSKISVKAVRKKPSQVNFIIFGDKVGIFSSGKPRTIIIKDDKVAEAFSLYFKIIWEQL